MNLSLEAQSTCIRVVVWDVSEIGNIGVQVYGSLRDSISLNVYGSI